ncbi:chemotaxis protein [Rheinheimera sp.]|uniref:chemotaxis protein n=1 Tax=Rheinheimera sp. TaxID=1869214 RepID=UPI00307D8C9B
MNFSAEQKDCLQELINVAMGLASDKLARFLGTFVHLQVPAIEFIQSCDIAEHFDQHVCSSEQAMISQGFLGNDGIRGEAILLYQLESAHTLASLFDYEQGTSSDLEMLMDISTILNSTFLNSLASQMMLQLTYSAPKTVATNSAGVKEAFVFSLQNAQLALKVDIRYQLTDYAFDCDMLLLIPGDAVVPLQRILSCILEQY